MATVTHHIPASPHDVYATLIDPTTYPKWLVGAKSIRAVDAFWPAIGSNFHHRVGLFGPLTIADSTESLGSEPERRLSLKARARPLGRARVDFELAEEGRGTMVTMHERPLGRLASVAPVLDPITAVRNRKSLGQLEQYLTGSR